MERAIKLAQQGAGITSPNPPVGAVIVHKGHIIGEGWHQGPGLPHAEREAIHDAIRQGSSSLLPESTLYVTLEPCSTHGRTPPCTDAIIEQHIPRVIFGSHDPNPVNASKAVDKLTHHHVTVKSGLMKEQCDSLIRPFTTAVKKKRPWILAKTAMTLDGRITRSSDFPQWFTGQAAKEYVHTLRSFADGILTGGETVRRDDPSLTIRTPGRPVSALKKQPWRIIMTCDAATIPPGSICLTDEFADRTVIIERVKKFESMLATLVDDYGIHQLMLECGGNLLRGFLERRLVDEWVGFYAPLINGGEKLAVDATSGFLPHEAYLDEIRHLSFERDLCIGGLVRYH